MLLQNDIDLIICRWQSGTYGLKQMKELVKQNIINEEQFFDITRYNYKGVVETERY